jgi:predicted acyl esterase
LKEGVEVSGPIEITLYVSSDAKDTDFTVKLVDVYPDGKAYNLDETIQRVRYREGYDKEVFMGGNNYDEAEGVETHNEVHHLKAHPSQIRVSIVKR